MFKLTIFASCLFSLAIFHVGYCSFSKPQHIITESNDTVFLQKWHNAGVKMKGFIEAGLKQVMPMLIRANSELDLSSNCTGSMLTLIRALRNFEVWPFRMIDASGKPGDGFLTGSTTQFGAYDQCLNITVPDTRNGGIKFRGQYCSIEIRFPMPPKPKHLYKLGEIVKPLDQYEADNPLFREFPQFVSYFYNFAYRMGVCVPSQCTIDDMQQIATSVASLLEYNAYVRGCEVLEEGLNMDLVQMIVIGILILFGVVVFTATIIDFWPEIMNKSKRKTDNPKSFGWELLEAFSARANTRKLLQTKNVGDVSILSLHGIRVISLTWIILGHTYFFVDMQLLQHFAKALPLIKSLSFQTVLNATPSVDSFFFLGGFLVCYLTIINVEKYGTQILNIPILIFRRIWRLLPSTMIVLGMMICLPLIGSGPIWKENVGREADLCRKKWWPIVIFFNSWTAPEEMCMAHTWYISTYMHLFLFSLVYLYVVLRKPKLGIILNVLFILTGVITTGTVTYFKDLPPTPLAIHPDNMQRLETGQLTHITTYAHTSSYGIGMALGHLIAVYRDKIKFTRKWLLIGWALAFACNLTIIYSVHIWIQEGDFTVVEAVVYASLYRVGWCLGLSWVVTVCAVGQGGLVNKFLSAKIFIPLSRLTYITYLVHVLLIEAFYGSMRATVEAENIIAVWFFIAFVVLSFGIGAICRLLFEAPILEVEKVILAKLLFSKIQSVTIGNNKEELDTTLPVCEIKEENNKNGSNGVHKTVENGSNGVHKTIEIGSNDVTVSKL